MRKNINFIDGWGKPATLVWGGDWSHVRGNSADFSYADLSGADLTPLGDLCGANFRGANLSNTTRTHTIDIFSLIAYDADFTQANLSKASYPTSFPGFPGAYMVRSKFNGANLTEINLSNADLTSADLSAADFTKANLTSTVLVGTVCGSTNFSQANLTNADLHGADLSCANFTGAIMIGANLGRVDTSTDFTDADLSYADFSHAFLDEANFTKANLFKANFSHARKLNKEEDWSGASFRGANLTEAIFDPDHKFEGDAYIGATLPDGTLYR
jgi:uncharacterized protein YjbI with pentapeptide repeats